MTLPVGELSGLCAAACWAIGSLLFARIGREGGVSPAAMNAAKCLLALGVLLAAGVASHRGLWPRQPTTVEASLLAASGLVGLAVGDTAYFGALRDLGASRAVLLLSTAPIFTVALESGWAGVLPPGKDLVGVATTLTGLGLALARSDQSVVSRLGRGLVLGLLAGLSQAVGNLLSRAATTDGVDPLTAAWMRLGVGAAFVVGAGVASGQGSMWVRQLRAPGLLRRVAVASLIGTVLGLLLSQVALARSSSGGVASTMLATSPLFALPIAHASGGERVTPRAALGALVAFGGVAILLS